MARDDLTDTLESIGRGPGDGFYRDTPMLLDALDRVTEINRRFQQVETEYRRRETDQK
jgi:hypothetical protein